MRINIERLWLRLEQLAEIGEIPMTMGSSRLALTTEDRDARDLVVTWMQDLGMAVSIDLVGNVVATWIGDKTNPENSAVMTGSHIDTVRTGGRFDGNLGVLAGLEVVETLAENNISPAHPISVAFFTGEEGARFAPDMLGSLVYVGGMTPRKPTISLVLMEHVLVTNSQELVITGRRLAQGQLPKHLLNYI